MLIKYIIILYLITPDYNDGLSIRKDIEFAKQFLKYHGISDENVCVKKYIEQLCSNDEKEICSARLLGKKMEFKQFNNSCYMDFNNFCDSQDNKSTDETEFITELTDETESTDETTFESATDETVTVVATITVTGDENLRMGEEIGTIVYDDGSKVALRQGNSTRFPPMKGIKTYKGEPCEKYVKPCPVLYFPICIYYERENPNNVTYYYFINSCEARQWTCYHPERPVHGSSSLRAGYCAHIQYINYARFVHVISAYGHYGWLQGPWRFNHILKPHERLN
ncbi:uncharacterized protein LOC134753227 isoform X1 [Cydia strobilella]|uniref:uncharacterized protein LOC134753227 isoform X1 n=1 Tax=Cydia strobilella TaxID=1100964 RepID=UPI0030045915